MNKINWQDKYKTELCIYHHLRECTRKYEKYVDVKSDIEIERVAHEYFKINNECAKEQAIHEYNKELIDLYLLIESLIEQDDLNFLVAERIQRFKENGDYYVNRK